LGSSAIMDETFFLLSMHGVLPMRKARDYALGVGVRSEGR
jgi:hypothetical protein